MTDEPKQKQARAELDRKALALEARLRTAAITATAEGDVFSSEELTRLADLLMAVATDDDETLKRILGNRVGTQVLYAKIALSADADDKDHDPETCVECRGRIQMLMAAEGARIGEA
jgi:hypothetical protein